MTQEDSESRFQADLRLSLNGYTSNLIGPNGTFQPRLTLLRPPMISENIKDSPLGAWKVEIGHQQLPCTIEEKDGRFHVIGPSLPLTGLLVGTPEFCFRCEGEPVRLIPIARKDRPAKAS
ncbi:MAG: hypothetical protein WA705_08830 [Candidatus Ozemobacteraceae bacterium]